MGGRHLKPWAVLVWLLSIAVASGALFLLNASTAQAATPQVTGITVIGANGLPVQGATVTATYTGYPGYVYSANTDVNGYVDLYGPNVYRDLTGITPPPYAPNVLWDIYIVPPVGSSDYAQYWDNQATSATTTQVYLVAGAPAHSTNIGSPPISGSSTNTNTNTNTTTTTPTRRWYRQTPPIDPVVPAPIVTSSSTPNPTSSPRPSATAEAAATTNNDVTANGENEIELTGVAFIESLMEQPSVFSEIRTPGSISEEFIRGCATAALTVVLAILIALPTALLDSVISSQHGRIGGFFRAVLPAGVTETDAQTGRRKSSKFSITEFLFRSVKGWWVVPTVFLGSIIASAADPEFGLNGKSLRILLLMVATFLLVNVLGTTIVWLLSRGDSGLARPKIAARPIYLILIMITVILARGLGAEPALVFGSVLAVDYGVRVSKFGSVKADFIGTAYVLLVGLISWFFYTLVQPSVVDLHSGNYWIVDLTAILCVQALSSLPLLLLPVAFLSGRNIFRWNKIVWVLYYSLVLAIYSFILIPFPFSWEKVDVPFAVWISIFVGYALLAVAVWLFFVLSNRQRRKIAVS